METPGDHEMEDEPCAGVEAEGDAFAEASNLGDFLPCQGINAGIEGANEKRAANADLAKGLLLDTGAKGFDVDRDVGEFRQGFLLPALGQRIRDQTIIVRQSVSLSDSWWIRHSRWLISSSP